jgi:methionine-rich copper-binding protein CopC
MRIVLLILSILLIAPTGVFAHAFLDHAAPRVGNTVAQAPKEVVLWFTQQLEPAFSSIQVRNEQGADVTAGKATVDRGDRTQMRVRLKSLSPGTYKVNWRVLSVDTHRTQGDFTFRVGP